MDPLARRATQIAASKAQALASADSDGTDTGRFASPALGAIDDRVSDDDSNGEMAPTKTTAVVPDTSHVDIYLFFKYLLTVFPIDY